MQRPKVAKGKRSGEILKAYVEGTSELGARGTFRLRRLLDQVLVVPKDEVEPEMQMEEDLLFQLARQLMRS